MIDEEPEDVRREVDGQHDEIDPVVVVEKVDANARIVYCFALHPE